MIVNGISTNGIQALESANAGKTGEFAGILSSSMNGAPVNLDALFNTASQKYNVPLNLLKAVAKVESSFNPNATSRCGAMGIMQLMPRTAKWLGVNDAYDPEQNIMGGAKYLSKLLNQYDGDTSLALAAYNAGPGTVRKYGGIPPFAQGYVNKVMRNCTGDITAGIRTVSPSATATVDIALRGEASDDNATIHLSSLMLLNAINHLRLRESMNVGQYKQNFNMINQEE